MSLNMSSEALAQFSRFAIFAKNNFTGSPKAVAKVGEAGAGGILEIDRNANDSPKNLVTCLFGRSKANQASNRTTRDLFLKTVSDMYGGEERIPFRVRTALKIDKGMFSTANDRPLTARRIKAVVDTMLEDVAFAKDLKITVGGNEMPSDEFKMYLRDGKGYQLEGVGDNGLINGNYSINNVRDDDDNNIIKTNTINDADTNTTVNKPQGSTQADLQNELAQLRKKQAEGSKLTMKERSRLLELGHKFNGVGVVPFFGTQSDTVKKPGKRDEEEV